MTLTTPPPIAAEPVDPEHQRALETAISTIPPTDLQAIDTFIEKKTREWIARFQAEEVPRIRQISRNERIFRTTVSGQILLGMDAIIEETTTFALSLPGVDVNHIDIIAPLARFKFLALTIAAATEIADTDMFAREAAILAAEQAPSKAH